MSKNLFKKLYQQIYYVLLQRHYYAITSPLRILPNFIIIGAVRCGTTSLYYNLCEHPSILAASYDELGFFDSNFHLGLYWYRSMFPTVIHKKYIECKNNFCITGEDTPFYFWNPLAAKRILRILPTVKLIAILRNPVDRAYSNYHIGLKYGNEQLSFEDAIDWEIKKLKENLHDQEKRIAKFNYPRSYLIKGLYAEQLRIWFKLFPQEQILVISTEEMVNNPQQALSEVFQFLNLPKYYLKNPQRRKVENYPKMKLETRKLLLDFFTPYNKELFSLLGKDFGWNK